MGGACNVMLLLLQLLACFFAFHARIWMLEVLILIYFAQRLAFSIHVQAMFTDLTFLAP